jgi:hypothetical protein
MKTGSQGSGSHELPQQVKNSLRVLGFAGMCVVFFIFHIWMRTLVLTKGYEVGERRHEVADLESQYMALKVERSRLMGPGSLEKVVKRFEERGIVFRAPLPDEIHYIRVEEPDGDSIEAPMLKSGRAR